LKQSKKAVKPQKSSKKEERPKQLLSYLIAFMKDNQLSDVHISDDLEDRATWEYIDLAFGVADYMVFFPRDDDRAITKREANHVLKYVQEDMEDYCAESEDDPKEVIEMNLLDGNTLVIGWKPLKLPKDMLELADLMIAIKEEVEDQAAQIANNPYSEHERMVRLLGNRGVRPDMLGKDLLSYSYTGRNQPFTGCDIPTDSILSKYAYCIGAQKFQDAGNLLADYYGIEAPKVAINEHDKMGENYVLYEHFGKTIYLSTERIPEQWQQFPAFLQGFFLHLSNAKGWSFDSDPITSLAKDKTEAENYTGRVIRRLIDIGINPMKASDNRKNSS